MKWEEMLTPVIDDEVTPSVRTEGLDRGFARANEKGLSGEDARRFAEIYAEDFIIGYKEGIVKIRQESIKNVMQTMGWTARKTMDALGIPLSEQWKYQAKLYWKDGIPKEVCEVLDRVEERGRDEARLESIKNIMITMKLTAEQAMDALLISPADQKRYRPLL